MSVPIRLLVEPVPTDPAWNMALDEALWLGAIHEDGPPTLRLYRWRAPSVSLGRLQRVEEEIDIEQCVARGVTVVRRPTGGGAVAHDGDLTFTLALPEAYGDLPEGILESYARIHSGIVEGLRTVGVSAELAVSVQRSSGLRQAPPCFVAPTRYDVVWRDRKIAGGAQRRGHGLLLHQGTLTLSLARPWMARLLKRWPLPAAQPSGRPAMAMATLQRAVVSGLERLLGVRCVPGQLTDAECRRAEQLQRTRYTTVDWTRDRECAIRVVV